MVKLCVGCHEIDLVVARRQLGGWDGVVEDMIARGTKGTKRNSAVAEYLSKISARCVNSATAKELQDGLRSEDARRS